MTIFLCGFMGCGKSTVGKILASNIGIPYYDTDVVIAEREGKGIPQIFSENGEPYFRSIEAEVVKNFCNVTAVVACGGGSMLNDDTAAFANSCGIVVFLDVPFDVCYERICGDSNRPLVVTDTKKDLYSRYNIRYPIYVKNSKFQVNAEKSPEECANEIVSRL